MVFNKYSQIFVISFEKYFGATNMVVDAPVYCILFKEIKIWKQKILAVYVRQLGGPPLLGGHHTKVSADTGLA